MEEKKLRDEGAEKQTGWKWNKNKAHDMEREREREDGEKRKGRMAITVCRGEGKWEHWPAGIRRRRREDKAREDLLKADNEGVIRSEIACRRSTNSSPHTRPYFLLYKMVRAHTHTPPWECRKIG